MVVPIDELEGSAGLHEACRLLFGPDAQRRYNEYFGGHHPLSERRARRAAKEARTP